MNSVIETWRNLDHGLLSFEDFYQSARSERELTFLTIDVNATCDLTCAACYYHEKINPRPSLISDVLIEQAITTARDDLKLRNLAFAGKEPFLSPDRLFRLIRLAGSLRKEQFTVGVITNGRHIHKHWANLEDLAERAFLTFLDVSLDSGYAIEHDTIRGVPGTFDLAAHAAANCQDRLPGVRIAISSVLYPNNAAGLIHLIRSRCNRNRSFWISAVQPPPYYTGEPVSGAAVASFAHDCATLLETELAGAGIEVVVQLPGPYVSDLEDAGLLSLDNIIEDDLGQCYFALQLGGNTFVLGLSVMPEYGWRAGRITATGAYLSHAHFLQTPNPDEFAAGSLWEHSIATLFERAKGQGSLFEQLIRSRTHHECRGRPCWAGCLGGLAISENEFLKKKPLTQKPSFCLKAPV